jgi:hypothetical protein
MVTSSSEKEGLRMAAYATESNFFLSLCAHVVLRLAVRS